MNDITRRLSALDFPLSYDSFNYPITETPETVLARRCPCSTLRLLNNESKRRSYNESLSIGAGVTETYLSRLDSEATSRIRQIRIEPNVWGGFGRGRGMVITFKR